MKPRPIRIVGDVAFVPLSNGREAMVDAADVHLVQGVNWSFDPCGKLCYASRVDLSGGHRKKIKLHRHILGATGPLHVDHRNGDGLDCRRANLRLATLQQNNLNRGTRTTNKLGIKGVFKQGNRYRAEIQLAGVKRYLGLFATPAAAHAAYCRASQELHGEFMRTD
jgi:hypothetical protein